MKLNHNKRLSFKKLFNFTQGIKKIQSTHSSTYLLKRTESNPRWRGESAKPRWGGLTREKKLIPLKKPDAPLALPSHPLYHTVPLEQVF
jgi:hypothetical protein